MSDKGINTLFGGDANHRNCIDVARKAIDDHEQIIVSVARAKEASDVHVYISESPSGGWSDREYGCNVVSVYRRSSTGLALTRPLSNILPHARPNKTLTDKFDTSFDTRVRP